MGSFYYNYRNLSIWCFLTQTSSRPKGLKILIQHPNFLKENESVHSFKKGVIDFCASSFKEVHHFTVFYLMLFLEFVNCMFIAYVNFY